MNYKRILNKDSICYGILLICVIIFGFLSFNTAPTFNGLPDVDSAVFQVMGRGMANGQIIYKDLFDHKGPIVYVINMLGYIISPKAGLFILEIVFMYLGTVYVYKAAKIFLGDKDISSIFISLIYLCASFLYMCGGNFTEEYAITFLSMGMYYILKIIYEKQYEKKLNWILIGLTFAINLFIKPTYISVWIAFGIIQLICSIKDKKIKDLFKYILYMLFGILIVTIPVLIYLILNSALYDFFDAYVLMNSKYSNFTIAQRISGFLTLISNYEYYVCLLIIYFGNALYLTNENANKRTKYFILIFTILSLILMIWAPNSYAHYLIQLSPVVDLSAIFIIIELNKLNNKFKDIPVKFIYICAIILFLGSSAYISSIRLGNFNKFKEDNKIIINDMNQVKELIKEDDEVLALGNSCWYYLLLNKIPRCKYFFQTPIISYDTENILNCVNNYIKESRPKVLIRHKDLYSVNCLRKNGFEINKEEYQKYNTKFFEYYVLKENN